MPVKSLQKIHLDQPLNAQSSANIAWKPTPQTHTPAGHSVVQQRSWSTSAAGTNLARSEWTGAPNIMKKNKPLIYTVNFAEIGLRDVRRVGGKNASLGERVIADEERRLPKKAVSAA